MGWTKGLKVFSGGSAMWREWRGIARTAKRVYVGECAGSRSMGRPRKRWLDTVKDEYQTLTRCNSCGLPQLYEICLSVTESIT